MDGSPSLADSDLGATALPCVTRLIGPVVTPLESATTKPPTTPGTQNARRYTDARGRRSGGMPSLGLLRGPGLLGLIGPSRPEHLVGDLLIAVLAQLQHLPEQRLEAVAAM